MKTVSPLTVAPWHLFTRDSEDGARPFNFRWAGPVAIASALLLSGCSAVSIDDNEYVPPARPFSTSGRQLPNANAIPPEL